MLDHQHCHYLEQEEDKLSTEVCQVEGGGSSSAQAGHLGHMATFSRMVTQENKRQNKAWHLFQVRCLAAWPETDGELLLLEHQRLHGRHRRHGALP